MKTRDSGNSFIRIDGTQLVKVHPKIAGWYFTWIPAGIPQEMLLGAHMAFADQLLDAATLRRQLREFGINSILEKENEET